MTLSLYQISMLGLVSACTAHVDLPTPRVATMSRKERVEMYSQYRPVSAFAIERCRSGACSLTADSIHFANGITVRRDEDLLPLVATDSATARHVARAHRDATIGRVLLFGGMALLATSVVYGGSKVFGEKAAADPSSHLSGSDTLLVGSGAVIGLVAMFVGGAGFWSKSDTEELAAFRSFDTDLAARLSICASGQAPGGQAFVPCEDLYGPR